MAVGTAMWLVWTFSSAVTATASLPISPSSEAATLPLECSEGTWRAFSKRAKVADLRHNRHGIDQSYADSLAGREGLPCPPKYHPGGAKRRRIARKSMA
jgi:hypothetical protein